MRFYAPSLVQHPHKLDVELQSGVLRDGSADAFPAVRERGRDHERALVADAHALDAHVPPGSNREAEGRLVMDRNNCTTRATTEPEVRNKGWGWGFLLTP